MKKVIYTCLTSEYDTLNDPKVTAKDYDYICFSNNLDPKDFNVWKIRRIPLESKNRVLLSRYVKIRPDVALSEYDISLYIDANIQIISNKFYDHLDKFISSKDPLIAAAIHPQRSCIYEEALICLKTGKSKYEETVEHIKFLKNKNFPKNMGLHENNIILRKHNDAVLIKAGQDWWKIFSNGVKRDQLSLEYILWKNNIQCLPLFDNDFDVRKSAWFSFSKHKFLLKHKLKKNIQKYRNRLNLLVRNKKI